jgi:Ca2+-binding EF-hand superfamily protein
MVEVTLAMEKNEKLTKHNEEIIQRWEEDLKNFHNEKMDLVNEIKELEKENKELLEKVVRQGKKKIKEVVRKTPQKSENKKKLDKLSLLSKFVNNDQKKKIAPYKKVLKFNNLTEIIHELYEAKRVQDKKVRVNWKNKLSPSSNKQFRETLVFETMEQFMYSHYKMKYGLKSLIIEQVELVIAAIEKYKEIDINIYLFGKILRNEVDENYHLVQSNVQRSIKDFIKDILQIKHMYKSQKEIKQLLPELINSGKLKELEYKQIAQVILSSKSNFNNFEKSITSWDMSVKDFMQMVSMFKLENYQTQILGFSKLFKQFDTDQDGVLSNDELSQFVELLNDKTKSILNLAADSIQRQLDPLGTDIVTFSHLLEYFLSFTIERENGNISFIQFLQELHSH